MVISAAKDYENHAYFFYLAFSLKQKCSEINVSHVLTCEAITYILLVNKQMQKKSAKEILQLLYSDDQKKYAEAINYLHQSMFSVIKYMIINKGGNEAIAEDVFWEGILEVDRWTSLRKFKPDSNVEGFLRTVCERNWYNKLERDRNIKNVKLPENIDALLKEDPISKLLLPKDIKRILEKMIDKIGENCKEKLDLFYFRGYSHQEIADMFNLASRRVVTVTISRCMKKLREEIEKAGGIELFIQ